MARNHGTRVHTSTRELMRQFNLLECGLPESLLEHHPHDSTKDPLHVVFTPNYVDPFFFRLGQPASSNLTFAEFKTIFYRKVFEQFGIDPPPGSTSHDISAHFPASFEEIYRTIRFDENNFLPLWELCCRAVASKEGACVYLSVDWVWADGKKVSHLHHIVDEDDEEYFALSPRSSAEKEREFRHRVLQPRRR